jgi:hypothetical protein
MDGTREAVPLAARQDLFRAPVIRKKPRVKHKGTKNTAAGNSSAPLGESVNEGSFSFRGFLGVIT